MKSLIKSLFLSLKRPETLGILAAFLSKFTARTDVIYGKELLKTSSPYTVAFLEIVTATALLFFYMGIRPFIQKMRELEWREVIALSASAAFSGVLGPILFLAGLSATSAINTSLLVNLNPLFLSLLAVVVLHETFTKKLILGLFIMLFGILFLATKGFSIGLSFNNGDFLIMLSALSYSAGTILFKKYVHNPHIELLVTYRSLLATIILGVGIAIFAPENLYALGNIKNQISPLIQYAIIGIILTCLLYYYALENTSIGNNAVFTLLSPIIGIVYAAKFLGEVITPIHIISMIIIIAGLMMTKVDLVQKTLLFTKYKLKHMHTT